MSSYEAIYFVVKNKKVGSAILRGIQISSELKKHGIPSYVITENEINKSERNSIFIWVKGINKRLVSELSNNVHVYDVVDAYIYKFSKVQKLLNENIVDHVIVNNSFMKNEIKETTNFKGNVLVIHHHWDPRISSAKKINQDELRFGFLGSVASLEHTDNFLHYRELIDTFSVEFYDSELGESVTDLVKQRKQVKIKHNSCAMDNLEINFNCHLSIRENDTDVSNYKTTAKLASSAALGHNIITTYERAVADVLPSDYPFILKDTSLDAVKNMFNLVKRDYGGERILWNRALSMMSDVKDELSIKRVIMKYAEMVESLI
tara:strand:- start:36 stop:992 length:957 start_codon:yes stop_codon:yes gene_type:complete